MEFRPYYFAKKWVELGHNVTIFSASYTHIRYQQPVVQSNYQTHNIDNVKYVFFKTISYRGNGFGRIINIFQFLYLIFRYYKKIIKESPDTIIASSTYPFDLLIGKYLSNKYDSKLVYEVHDLWPLSITELHGYSSINPAIFLMQINENYNYKNADYVISMLPNAKEYMISHGLSSEKFNYIPNGYEKEKRKEKSKFPTLLRMQLDKIKAKEKKIIGYAGYHHTQNSLMCLIKTAEIASRENIHFFLIGDGPEKSDLEEYAKIKFLNNVSFFPPVPKNIVQEVLSEFDFLYIGFVGSKLYEYGIAPNKLLDYLMSGKPVLLSGSASNNIVEIANAGESVEPDSPEKIYSALKKMMEYNTNRLQQIKMTSKAYVRKHHNFDILAKRFISVMEKD